MILFDTHTNLHSERFDSDRADVLERARLAGVSGFIAICDRLDNFEKVLAIAESADDIWCSLGVHPHHAKDYTDLSADHLVALASQTSKIRAIGETGLDYYYGHSPSEQQKLVLRIQIDAARKTQLPLILHCRDADHDMEKILIDEYEKGAFDLLMHCYTGGANLAKQALAIGAYFSVSGIFTFKNAEPVRNVMRDIPLNRILLETDCPYLAPPPHRGQRNEPAFLPHICTALANLHETDNAHIAKTTTQNARDFFRI